MPAPTNSHTTTHPAASRPFRIKMMLSRLLMCTTGGSSEATSAAMPSPASRRRTRPNPHRRSGIINAQQGGHHAIRKTFPISALSLLVNVKRDSIRLLDGLLFIQVDTLQPAKLTLVSLKKGTIVEQTDISMGMNQTVTLKQPKPGIYCIKVQASDDNDPCTVKTQRTDIELDGNGNVKVAGQYMQLDNGALFNLLEIYGRPRSSLGSVPESATEECVVCLTQSRDTIVLPCRHLCLCTDCAELLRSRVDKCPICRESCQGLLFVRHSDDSDL